MKRRNAIKNTAYVFGGVLSASTIASIFDSCVAPAAGDVWTPDLLSVSEGEMLTRIADILIPTTDTPGAVDALIPQFVDRFLNIMTTEDEKKLVQEGFTNFNAACKKTNGKAFLDCSDADQLAFLQSEEKNFVNSTSEEVNFFGEMKQLIYRGFFTSEEGATEVLKFDPVPGNYDGCIPYSQVNGTWAT